MTIRTGTSHLPPERISRARQLASTSDRRHPVRRRSAALAARDGRIGRTGSASVDGVAAPPGQCRRRRRRVSWSPTTTPTCATISARILGQHYRVEVVGDGRAALDRIRASAPDLVLADVMMPTLDGFGLVAAIRADEQSRSLPVILLSARAGEEARIEGLKAGADEYLVKPFSARELLACVASQLALSRMRRETEGALRYRSEQFQTLLNQAPLGVYVVDADFRIREVNPVALPVFGDIPGGVDRPRLRRGHPHPVGQGLRG